MAGVAISIAVAAAFFIGGAATRFGTRWGVVDEADGYLKTHVGSPVPLGGVAVFVGAHLGLVAIGSFDSGLFVATSLLWVIGLIDDLRGLSPLVRLGGSLGAAVILVAMSFQTSGLFEGLFWVVAVVVSVNAVNLFDGLDALAGSVTAVTFLGMSWFAVVQRSGDPVVGLILAGAMLGFLFWNRPPARLYLGDNGAYVVALLMIWLAGQVSPDFGAGVVAAGLIGVLVLDLGVTIFRRYRSRAEMFAGDRDHTYDILHRQGHSVGKVVATFVAAQVVWVSIVVATSEYLGDRIAFAVASGLGVVVVLWGGRWVTRNRELWEPG